MTSEEWLIYIFVIHGTIKKFLELVHCRIQNSSRTLFFSLQERFIKFVFQNLSVNASIFTLTAIAVDRYFYSIRKETNRI